MVVYITGLVLVTSAIELTLALVLASWGALPSPSSSFLLIYLLIDVGLFVAGGFLVAGGLRTLQTKRPSARPESMPPDRPSE
jgi:hypothetical protein